MLAILSPSKTLDFTKPAKGHYSQPCFAEEIKILSNILKICSPQKIKELMDVSDNIAVLNHGRYQDFTMPFTPENARQALFAFRGDVYDGLKAESFSGGDIEYANEHIRILSGLYGLLKPLDLIQPYRLEMGTALENPGGKNLYEFWGNSITMALQEALKSQGDDILINLSSGEYFKAVKPKLLNADIITPVFKEYTKGSYKVIMLYAKQARGMMARFLVKERPGKPEYLKDFRDSGYSFNQKLSVASEWVFTREARG